MRTIVHIFSTVDGRISGPFMVADHAARSREAYGRIREQFKPDAILYGATTAKAFASEAKDASASPAAEVPAGDYAGQLEPGSFDEYLVAIDADGEIFWDSPFLVRPGRPTAAVIEIVTGRTPKRFLAHLREKGIPYVMAGEDELDCRMALGKLEALFGISTLLLCGGGLADWSFLEAGCVDEVSLVLAPAISGDPDAATAFDWLRGVNEGGPVGLHLVQAKPIAGDGVHLVYQVTDD